jgi:hypothetical protein
MTPHITLIILAGGHWASSVTQLYDLNDHLIRNHLNIADFLLFVLIFFQEKAISFKYDQGLEKILRIEEIQ